MSFARWLRHLTTAWQGRKSAGNGRRTARSRPRLEFLEERITPDAGDTLRQSLNTHLGPSTGTYTMASEHLGDGKFGVLDVDLYHLRARAGEVLTARTSPAAGGTVMDTYLRLFDANGNELAANDNYNWPSLSSRIQNYVFSTSGDYYVGVSGAPNDYYNPTVGGSGTPWSTPSTGDYRLDLNLFVPTADTAGDTLAAAQATGLGPTAGSFGVDAQVGDGLYLNKDVDLYRIDVNAGQLLTAKTSLPAGGVSMATILRLFDASGNQLTSDWYGNYPYSQFRYQFAAGGTYYVGVSGQYNGYYDPNVGGSGYEGSTGDYHLDLTLATPVADAEPDSIPDVTTTSLLADGSYTHTARIGDGLYPLEDVDLYRIDASANQVLAAVTSLPTGGTAMNGITLRLFSSSGSQLATYYYGSSSAARIDYQFATAGTYYVGVSGYPNTSYDPNVAGSGPYYSWSMPATGDYQISLSLATPVADAEPDQISDATTTSLAGDGTFSHTAKVGDGLYPFKDVDLYRVEVSANQVLTASTSQPTGGTYTYPVLRLFDAAGNQLGYTTYYYNNRLEYQFAGAGTYYVGVSGAYNAYYNPNSAGSGYSGYRGDYTLNLALATPTAGSDAPDTIGDVTATSLGPDNGTFGVNGTIGDGQHPLRDVDLYRIEVTAGQGLIAATSQVSGGTFLFPTLRLFDSAGHQLFLGNNYPNPSFRHVFATSGTYYVGVSGSGNNAYDPTTVTTSGAPVGPRGDYHLDLSLVTPVVDSEGDTLAGALATGLGRAPGTYTHTARIGDNFFANKDVDLYAFSATAGQRLSVTLSGTGSTPLNYGLMRLFDSAGHQLAFGYSFSAIQNYTLAADGTYYLGVSGYSNAGYNPNVAGSGDAAFYTGDYSVAMTLLTLTPDAEPDRIADLTTTSLGPTDGTFRHTARIGDGLYPERDVDLYRVVVNAGQYLKVAISQPAGGALLYPAVRLFDSAGHELALNDSYWSSNTSLEYQFATGGTYYIGVSGYYNLYYNPNVAGSGASYTSRGDYQIDMALVTPTPDAEGETIATAVATGLGSADGSYSHTAAVGDGLYLRKDVDMYRIDALAGQVVTIRASIPDGSAYFNRSLRLFDRWGNELATGNDVIEYNITADGPYYVGVSGYWNWNYDPNVAGSGTPYYPAETGDYRLDLALVTPTPDAVGDTIPTALDTRLGPSAGTYSINSRIGDGLYVSRDVDMYRVQVAEGQVFTAVASVPTAGAPAHVILTLWDDQGNFVNQGSGDWWDPNWDGTIRLEMGFHRGGTYYLALSAEPNYWFDPFTPGSGYPGDHGDYSLTMSLDRLTTQPVGGGEAVASVSGHAVWDQTVGVPDGGIWMNQISVNAWLDASGTAHGTLTWSGTYNYLPGNPWGATLVMRVTSLVIDGNTAHIEAVVVSSNRAGFDVGSRFSFDIVDNGPGSQDTLDGSPLESGNFTIR